MFLETWLTWIANHVGSTLFKNASGVRKDLVDTKKAKLEINKLEEEAKEKAKGKESLITPASFDDVKTYDPKYKQITDNALLLEIADLKERLTIQEQLQKHMEAARKIKELIITLLLAGFMLLELVRLVLHFLKQ